METNTTALDESLDMALRLDKMRNAQKNWEAEDKILSDMTEHLDPTVFIDRQKGIQIAALRKQAMFTLIYKPFEISSELLKNRGFFKIRECFQSQYANFTTEDKMLWLNNFLFVITPDIRSLNKKIQAVREFRSMGQQRNFLISGVSGSGKSTFQHWLMSLEKPQEDMLERKNRVPLVRIDAPVNNKSPKPLLQRLIMTCGANYFSRSDREEDLLEKLVLIFQQCHVEVVFIDEIEHLRKNEIKRRLLELSNLTPGITYVCSSCNASSWTESDVEIRGRWNDHFKLKQYTGRRLTQLLMQIELMLPFSTPSNIFYATLPKTSETPEMDGPAKLIEQMTGGVLRDIMILVGDSCKWAIDHNLSCITPSLLEISWKRIQENRVVDFLTLLKNGKDR